MDPFDIMLVSTKSIKSVIFSLRWTHPIIWETETILGYFLYFKTIAPPDYWKYWKKLFWKIVQKWIPKLIKMNIIEMSLKINISCDI